MALEVPFAVLFSNTTEEFEAMILTVPEVLLMAPPEIEAELFEKLESTIVVVPWLLLIAPPDWEEKFDQDLTLFTVIVWALLIRTPLLLLPITELLLPWMTSLLPCMLFFVEACQFETTSSEPMINVLSPLSAMAPESPPILSERVKVRLVLLSWTL